MNIQEIKNAVDSGKSVKWGNDAYDVIKDNCGQYLILCSLNQHCIGLHGVEGSKYENRLNGVEGQFYVKD